MSEKVSEPAEQLHTTPESAPEAPEKPGESAERFNDINQPDRLAEIQKSIEQHATSGAELTPAEPRQPPGSHNLVSRELKQQSLDRTLTRVRKQLNPAEKVLSRITHQPIIDKLSDLGGQTAARPSGIIGGGLFALLGSSFILYFAKHYGFEYNFLAFFALFVAGFALGLLTELGIKLVRK
jgi:hypothetical protein